jgi:phosphatidylserine/phosphatidylglycerophosphate/cardiolipin synthase-like enzyme
MKFSGRTVVFLVFFFFLLGRGFSELNLTGVVLFSNSEFDTVQSAFCPSSLCVELVKTTIQQSHSRIWVAMYSFTNGDFLNELIEASNDGVEIRVLLEKQLASSKYSVFEQLKKSGIDVRLDSNPSLMHHKFAVIDSSFVLTGSMNWSRNGVARNNENLVVIHSQELNSSFAEEFEKLWNDSLELKIF